MTNTKQSSADQALEVNAWYCFVTVQFDYDRNEDYDRYDGIYQYLGDGVWADEHEALDVTPDYDRLVRQ
jgi:hypothetical protein